MISSVARGVGLLLAKVKAEYRASENVLLPSMGEPMTLSIPFSVSSPTSGIQ